MLKVIRIKVQAKKRIINLVDMILKFLGEKMHLFVFDDSNVSGRRAEHNFIQPSGERLQPMVVFLQYDGSKKAQFA